MKYLFILFFILSIFLTSIQIFATKNFPVMLQIKSELNIPDDLRTGIEEGLTENNFSLISEETQKEALKEQTQQRKKECYDESCLVDTGKMLAAKGLVIVEIIKKNEKYYLFKAKYIDFESGTTQKTKSDYFEYDLNEFKELNKFGKNLIINTMVKKENKEEIKEIETAETTESKINDKIKENNTIIECEYKIYTNIFGASIYVDNEYKGISPLTINVKKGKHTIKAVKENYTAYFEEVSIFEDDELYIKLNENKIVNENKSKEFFREINVELFTSYKYLDFKNAETKNIFAIGFYAHYLYVRFDNFSISIVGLGGGYCNNELLEVSLHLGEVKYFIKNIELNLSLLGLLGRFTFIGARDKDDKKDIAFQWGGLKVGYFYQTYNFAIRPFVTFGIWQLEEINDSDSDKIFGSELGFVYGFGISVDFDGKNPEPVYMKRK